MIYFIQDSVSKYVKIGYTNLKIQARISALQTGNPNPLICLRVIESEDEAGYHKMFEMYHHRGEWFRPGTDLMGFIESLPKTKHTDMVAGSRDIDRSRLSFREYWNSSIWPAPLGSTAASVSRPKPGSRGSMRKRG